MTEEVAAWKATRGRPVQSYSDLEQTIVRIISERSDATFGVIVSQVRNAFPMSRAAVARRLARMLRYSQIVRLRHGHYALGNVPTNTPSTVLRLRSYSISEYISPDGSSWAELGKEFLVLSGRCDRITFQLHPMMRLLTKDVSVSGSRRVRLTIRNLRGRTTIVAHFVPPILAARSVTHRLRLSFRLRAQYYLMKQQPDDDSRPRSATIPRPNLHAIGVMTKPDLGVLVEASDETVLDLRVYFPSGFPRGQILPDMSYMLSDESLKGGARKLLDLSRRSKGRLGLTIRDGLVTVQIKNPTVDCFYGFTWIPPTASSYAHWICQHQ